MINRHRYVKHDCAPRCWDRIKVAKEAGDHHLDNFRKQTEKRVARVVVTKVGKAVACLWSKLVLAQHIFSIAYDVYDLASRRVDVCRQIKWSRA